MLQPSPMSRHFIALSALLVSAVALLNAGGWQPGEAHLSFQVLKSFHLPPGSSFGITAPTEALQLEVVLENEDLARTLVVKPGFLKALRWQLIPPRGERGEPLEMTADWADLVTCGSPPAECSHELEIVLQPDHQMMSRVTLKLAQGPIHPGEYRIAYLGHGARDLLSGGGSSPWTGRFVESGSVPLTAIAPTTTDERVRHHMTEAGDAFGRKNYEAALVELRNVVRERPTDPEAHAGIGVMLLKRGRFQEAAAELETALALLGAGGYHSVLPQDLAVAYIALGRDADAELLIRQSFGERLLPRIMEVVKKRATNLEARPPRQE